MCNSRSKTSKWLNSINSRALPHFLATVLKLSKKYVWVSFSINYQHMVYRIMQHWINRKKYVSAVFQLQNSCTTPFATCIFFPKTKTIHQTNFNKVYRPHLAVGPGLGLCPGEYNRQSWRSTRVRRERMPLFTKFHPYTRLKVCWMWIVGEAAPALPAPLKPLPFLLSSCHMRNLLKMPPYCNSKKSKV